MCPPCKRRQSWPPHREATRPGWRIFSSDTSSPSQIICDRQQLRNRALPGYHLFFKPASQEKGRSVCKCANRGMGRMYAPCPAPPKLAQVGGLGAHARDIELRLFDEGRPPPRHRIFTPERKNTRILPKRYFITPQNIPFSRKNIFHLGGKYF